MAEQDIAESAEAVSEVEVVVVQVGIPVPSNDSTDEWAGGARHIRHCLGSPSGHRPAQNALQIVNCRS